YARDTPVWSSLFSHLFAFSYIESLFPHLSSFFFFNATATTEIYTLSLHDALPIYTRYGEFWTERKVWHKFLRTAESGENRYDLRSEEHTSELQSRFDLVCRLLLEKKKKKKETDTTNMKETTRTTIATKNRR